MIYGHLGSYYLGVYEYLEGENGSSVRMRCMAPHAT